MDLDELFILLQVNDAGFPIGSYTHSLGLETYIQQGKVKDANSARLYIEQNLRTSFLYTELLPLALAYDAAKDEDLDYISFLEDLLFTSKSPVELRNAALKLGTRFGSTSIKVKKPGDIMARYIERVGKRVSHAIAYAVFCAGCGIEKEAAMAAYLFAQSASMVTNCVKTVPLSQSDGQIILSGLHALFTELLSKIGTLTEDDLCRSTPGLDIASMQHERLYSRLYIS